LPRPSLVSPSSPSSIQCSIRRQYEHDIPPRNKKLV
jgi:hypothetical protein